MNNIKTLKAQSLLQEVIQEALFSLNDTRINSLNITNVECSKGKEFARVFLDPISLDDSEKQEVLRLLKKANGIIRAYLQSSLSWYKIPHLAYEFDDTLNSINRLDSIFKQIEAKHAK